MATQVLADLTPQELDVVAQLADRVRESARLVVRAKLEDAAVRVARKSSWCDEFRAHALRVIGAPHGPKVAWRFDRTGKDTIHARVEFRDSDGIDCAGYDVNGWLNGYGPDGFNREGLDKDGYNRDGLDANGWSKYRFDTRGRDKDGYDHRGLDTDGYDREGYSRDGYNRDGRNRQGLDYDGYDADGYSTDGVNRNGLRRDGMDRFGLSPFRFNGRGIDADGFNRDGYNPMTGLYRPGVES
jgi:hypothetical protein